ncbi:MAG: ribosome biogenesis protein [Zestosphaera tikiterensis]|uniref:Ribosome biogenesis protein Nop10 n=1 Tax=Zestosphaera tikiterensis TaxID=1973259 RepID=A0A2R7Y5N0_9CREN|nr:MAG: ribosome biogenesis protein [Zestosphaera tikiterensis]
MKFLIRKCVKCGKYTLKTKCPACGAETVTAHPPKYSPNDKYLTYRIKVKYENMQTQNSNNQK